MKFSLLVLGAPYSTQSVQSALRFAQAATDAGHELFRVFFYHDAVHSGSAQSTPGQDEPAIPQHWADFAATHDTDLVLCVASALKRGILDEGEARRYDKLNTLQAGFGISGLGQLVEALTLSDRVISFGP